jgi:hypothetical protein
MDDLCILIQEVEEYFDNNPDHFITDQFMTFRQNLNNDCAMLNGVITTLTNFAKNTPFRQRRLLRSQRTN